jgi:hypothetical protein
MPKVQQFVFPLLKLNSILQITEAVKDAQALKSATSDVQLLDANATTRSPAPVATATSAQAREWSEGLIQTSGLAGDAVDTGTQVSAPTPFGG